MIDAFSLFSIDPHPWIDQDKLKSKFLKLSESHHPDRVGLTSSPTAVQADQIYADINAAFGVLKSHRDRLALLWELETGEKAPSTANMPEDLTALFLEVGQVCVEVARFNTERLKLTSPILKAQAFGESLIWTQRLQEIQSKVSDLELVFASDLIALDQQWKSLESTTRRENLLRFHFRASCLQRWKDQLRERISQLAF